MRGVEWHPSGASVGFLAVLLSACSNSDSGGPACAAYFCDHGASSTPDARVSPARAALTITVTPGPGCTPRVQQLSIPDDPSVHDNLLACDLSTGCAPDAAYVSLMKDLVQVDCQVSPYGAQYYFNFYVNADQMNLDGGGSVGLTGGTINFEESDQQGVASNGVTLADRNCKIDIAPNHGILQEGAIWARFHCDNFEPIGGMVGSACKAEGAFLFENCTAPKY